MRPVLLAQNPTEPLTTPLAKPAPVQREVVTPRRKPLPVPDFPPMDVADPEAAWDAFFEKNTPPPAAVARHMLVLHGAGKHDQVIAGLRAALIHGQSQPWMYEALAGSLQIQKAPKEEVERALLSMNDFGQVDFSQMMMSGAYLVRFGRIDTALRMYRQASRLEPERSEPYILSLEHEKSLPPQDVVWAACGVLQYDWGPTRAEHRSMALDVLAQVERTLKQKGDQDALEKLRQDVAEAQRLDLEVVLTWSGAGDLDLEVEEPGAGLCSVVQPISSGGGYHLGDGYGPRPEDCRETYVCPRGLTGDYRIRVKHSFGAIVGQRATLVITTMKGTPSEKVERRTLVLESGTATATATVPQGRRTVPRVVVIPEAPRPVVNRGAVRPGIRRDRAVQPVAGQRPVGAGAGIGVVGAQPVVQTLQEGATLGATAVVSPDRRYVRIGVQPNFTNITDVFTFSYFNGPPNGQGNGGPAQPFNQAPRNR